MVFLQKYNIFYKILKLKIISKEKLHLILEFMEIKNLRKNNLYDIILEIYDLEGGFNA
ncbi:hypothetical protein GCWU000323_01953 [Leptotrichia hofstadii F0254]|uniref:Uncharacterized protein n=1 Tax=Leptotrichia hofstadii F0254 TaxID=634994 RepID=C9MZI3_9FUSO|nr:hypothetical protein GCWU000323_01953 [Leptotrichia hofstadii F0254]